MFIYKKLPGRAGRPSNRSSQQNENADADEVDDDDQTPSSSIRGTPISEPGSSSFTTPLQPTRGAKRRPYPPNRKAPKVKEILPNEGDSGMVSEKDAGDYVRTATTAERQLKKKEAALKEKRVSGMYFKTSDLFVNSIT
jgi:hypothetical protein